MLELSLVDAIIKHPLPGGWEIRKCSDGQNSNDSVYFYHVGTSKPTAVLWRDTLYQQCSDFDLLPLPPGWTRLLRHGKIHYKDPAGRETKTSPKSTPKSNFSTVLSPHPQIDPYSQMLVSRLPFPMINRAQKSESDKDLDDLPSGWERRRSPQGRFTYVNLNTEITSQVHPRWSKSN